MPPRPFRVESVKMLAWVFTGLKPGAIGCLKSDKEKICVCRVVVMMGPHSSFYSLMMSGRHAPRSIAVMVHQLKWLW
jgi:hypothetical protein